MNKKKKIIYGLLAVLVLIQFIRPARNTGDLDTEKAIFTDEKVGSILQIGCYDCHSNNTNYPWYTNVQPLGWWLDHHITEGKRELNFSEFEGYTLKRKLHKLKEIKKQIEEDEMPMSSYTLVHSEAKLSPEQKDLLIKWTEETTKYLSDTLSHK